MEIVINSNGGQVPPVFWITENGILSGDTHSVVVWNRILEKCNLKVTQEEYNNGKSVIHTIPENAFLEMGLTQEEVDVLHARIPVRWYAVENWDWIRCRKVKDGYVAQTKELSPKIKRRLEVLPVGSTVIVETDKKESEWLI